MTQTGGIVRVVLEDLGVIAVKAMEPAGRGKPEKAVSVLGQVPDGHARLLGHQGHMLEARRLLGKTDCREKQRQNDHPLEKTSVGNHRLGIVFLKLIFRS